MALACHRPRRPTLKRAAARRVRLFLQESIARFRQNHTLLNAFMNAQFSRGRCSNYGVQLCCSNYAPQVTSTSSPLAASEPKPVSEPTPVSGPAPATGLKLATKTALSPESNTWCCTRDARLKTRRPSVPQPLTGLGAARRLLQSAERHPEPTGLTPGGRERRAVAPPRGHFQPAGPFRQGAASLVPRVSRCHRRRVPCP
eukprot:scaffold55517_cov63-Phaeocystis_antarctica.AAC.4